MVGLPTLVKLCHGVINTCCDVIFLIPPLPCIQHMLWFVHLVYHFWLQCHLIYERHQPSWTALWPLPVFSYLQTC